MTIIIAKVLLVLTATGWCAMGAFLWWRGDNVGASASLVIAYSVAALFTAAFL